ncbi:hypothetical protein CcI49_25670 [Frankia sp. CcI49]|nr:hypothetical protein CcI49_25670 [Frankia sp. CcI49]
MSNECEYRGSPTVSPGLAGRIVGNADDAHGTKQEILMTGTAALLVMDMINDVIHPAGQYAHHGYAAQVEQRGVLDRTVEAIERFRAAELPVIYVVVGFSADYSEWPERSPVFAEARPAEKLRLGTWATEIHDRLPRAAGEPVIVKHRISPFYGTELALRLRTWGVDKLMLSGVSTDLVVLSTAREAHDRDFDVEVLADATASLSQELHEAALTLIARTATVTTVDQAFAGQPGPAPRSRRSRAGSPAPSPTP